MRAFALLFVLGAGTASFAGFNFTFDSDNQGWTKGDLGGTFATIQTNTQGGADWNAAGYITGSDFSSYAYLFSGDLGGNHGDAFGTALSLDFRTAGAGGDNPFIVLLSSDAFLVKQQAHPASAGFINYSYQLDSTGGWYYNSSPYYNGGNAVLATDAQILAVLNDLRHIGVSSDIASGGDTVWVDNINAVPEPATLGLLALGALAARRRRKA